MTTPIILRDGEQFIKFEGSRAIIDCCIWLCQNNDVIKNVRLKYTSTFWNKEAIVTYRGIKKDGI